MYSDVSPTSAYGAAKEVAKGTTINDLGRGPEEIEKNILEALLHGKINLKRHSPGKNKSQKAFPKKK